MPPVLSLLVCPRCGGPVSPTDNGAPRCDQCHQPYLYQQSAATTATTAAAPRSASPPRHVPGPNSPPAPGPRLDHYTVGQGVWIFWGTGWYAGSIVRAAAPGAWEITYTGWGTHWNEVVGPERLAAASS